MGHPILPSMPRPRSGCRPTPHCGLVLGCPLGSRIIRRSGTWLGLVCQPCGLLARFRPRFDRRRLDLRLAQAKPVRRLRGAESERSLPWLLGELALIRHSLSNVCFGFCSGESTQARQCIRIDSFDIEGTGNERISGCTSHHAGSEIVREMFGWRNFNCGHSARRARWISQ